MTDPRQKEDPGARRLARQAVWLLAAMTLASVGGPVVMLLAIRGGPSPEWPPDRNLEWGVFVGVIALVLALMTLSIAVALRNQKIATKQRAEKKSD